MWWCMADAVGPWREPSAQKKPKAHFLSFDKKQSTICAARLL